MAKTGPKPLDPRELIERNVERIPIAGCWLWTAHLNDKGYGKAIVGGWRGRRCVRAHRRSYEVFVGPIPDGLNVLHRCDTPSCVNPAHLTVGTQSENVKQGWDRGRRERQRKGM